MFLALKEIKHEKLRYGLIISMVVLISYLIFILTSLAQGLSGQNTEAIQTWHAQQIVLNKDSNISMRQSFITKQQADDLHQGKNDALIGQAGVVIKHSGNQNVTGTFIGIKPNQYIYQDMKLTSGHMPQNDHEIVADTSLENNGYKLNQWVQLNSISQKYQIVGFTKNAKINISPTVYGRLSGWNAISNLNPNFVGNALVTKDSHYQVKSTDLKAYSINDFINNLPGYTAQNTTFEFMIGFLMVISLIVIAIFLYIITNQKLQNYGVLRGQGIPAKTFVINTISQSLILVISGILIGAGLTYLTSVFIPESVPMSFNIPVLSVVGIGLTLTSILGAILPVRTILKIDPIKVIG